MFMYDELAALAARLRELRDACGFTSAEVSERLNIDETALSRFETDGTDVPISVLYQLANMYGVSFEELMTGSAPHLDTLCVVRQGGRSPVDRYPGYQFFSLAPTFKHKMMEPLLVSVEPEGHDPALVRHPGQEFNFVLEGEIELIFNDKRVLLSPGDCVYFNPTYPHGQKAIGGTAKFLTVICE